MTNFLPGVTSNCDLPDLCLPNGEDSGEPPYPALLFFLVYFSMSIFSYQYSKLVLLSCPVLRHNDCTIVDLGIPHFQPVVFLNSGKHNF
jgi:hypothetical protein